MLLVLEEAKELVPASRERGWSFLSPGEERSRRANSEEEQKLEVESARSNEHGANEGLIKDMWVPQRRVKDRGRCVGVVHDTSEGALKHGDVERGSPDWGGWSDPGSEDEADSDRRGRPNGSYAVCVLISVGVVGATVGESFSTPRVVFIRVFFL